MLVVVLDLYSLSSFNKSSLNEIRSCIVIGPGDNLGLFPWASSFAEFNKFGISPDILFYN